MKTFKCHNCHSTVFFENTICSSCNHLLGYNPKSETMISLFPKDDNNFQDNASGDLYKFCKNYNLDSCNWLIPANKTDDFCIACTLNRIIPNLDNPIHLKRWQKIELDKKRLVYSLLKWELPLADEKRELQLTFDFKATSEEEKVLTGHAKGLITLNIQEADDVERELAKRDLEEVYRTVLGHFRHEVGHFYWDVLIAKNPILLKEFRNLFGDETYDYQTALDTHYKNGAPDNWAENFISSYATMHPWEDWAESWAHYFHIVDTLETAYYSGIHITPKISNVILTTDLNFQPYFENDFHKIMNNWMGISIALNNINRSIGLNDLYPFIVNASVFQKLNFIHKIIHQDTKMFY